MTEATAMDRRRNEFLAMLAHELRNPLQSINMASAFLARQQAADSPDAHLRAFEVIGRQVRHLSRLIEDLMDVGSIEQGKFSIRNEPVDLHCVIQAAIETNAPLLAERKVTVQVAPTDTPVWLWGDFGRLTQVFVNLLHNAAKFSRTGGAVHVDTFPPLDGLDVAVSVRDEGVGLAPELRESVFELFAQGHSPLSGVGAQGGLGIGLYVVRSVVQSHGGSVTLHSDGIGKGCEFVVTLPLLGGPPPNLRTSTPQPAPELATIG